MDKSPTRISANVAGTLDGLFRERVRLSPDHPAYCHYHRNNNAWQDIT